MGDRGRHSIIVIIIIIMHFMIIIIIIINSDTNNNNNDSTVSFHNFKSQKFKLSVSNPKSKYVAYMSVLSRISNCQGLGRKNRHEIVKTDRSNNHSNIDINEVAEAVYICIYNI